MSGGFGLAYISSVPPWLLELMVTWDLKAFSERVLCSLWSSACQLLGSHWCYNCFQFGLLFSPRLCVTDGSSSSCPGFWAYGILENNSVLASFHLVA